MSVDLKNMAKNHYNYLHCHRHGKEKFNKAITLQLEVK